MLMVELPWVEPKLEPVIVTVCPGGPMGGETLVTVGWEALTVKALLLLALVRSGFVTVAV
jgi:hypothetical protein